MTGNNIVRAQTTTRARSVRPYTTNCGHSAVAADAGSQMCRAFRVFNDARNNIILAGSQSVGFSATNGQCKSVSSTVPFGLKITEVAGQFSFEACAGSTCGGGLTSPCVRHDSPYAKYPWASALAIQMSNTLSSH